MNGIKQTTSKISSETFYSRRSSLPITVLDFKSNADLWDMAKKKNLHRHLGQISPNAMNLPKILVDRRSSTNSTENNSPLNLTTSFGSNPTKQLNPFCYTNALLHGLGPPAPSGPESAYRRNSDTSCLYIGRKSTGSLGSSVFLGGPQVPHVTPTEISENSENLEDFLTPHKYIPKRAASLGNCLIKTPQDLRTNMLNNLVKCKLVRTQSSSPRLVGMKSPQITPLRDFENSPKESLSARNSSIMRLPTLSPCPEDKPKSPLFAFSQLTPNSKAGSEMETKEKKKIGLSERNTNSLGLSERSNNNSAYAYQFENAYTDKLKPNEQYSNSRRRSFDPSYIRSRKNSLVSTGSNAFNESAVDRSLEHTNLSLLLSPRLMEVDSLLGKGGFGIVKVGRWKGEKVAVKMVRGRKATNSVESERNSLNFVKHMNVVQTKAVVYNCEESSDSAIVEKCDDNFDITATQTSTQNLFRALRISDFLERDLSGDLTWALTISELCTTTNLLNVINSTVRINVFDKISILRQIANGLKSVHQAGFSHLDVKPSNCFLTASGVVKLGDFGCVTKLNTRSNKVVGTVAYQAPEALRGDIVTEKCDMYSLSMTGWHLLYRKTPYEGYHPHVIIYKVTRLHQRPTRPKSTKEINLVEDAIYSVISRCWNKQPEARLSTDTFIRVIGSLAYLIEL